MKTAALNSLTDEQLISFINCGDRTAFGELYSRYYKKVYHKCISIIKDQDEAFDPCPGNFAESVQQAGYLPQRIHFFNLAFYYYPTALPGSVAEGEEKRGRFGCE